MSSNPFVDTARRRPAHSAEDEERARFEGQRALPEKAEREPPSPPAPAQATAEGSELGAAE